MYVPCTGEERRRGYWGYRDTVDRFIPGTAASGGCSAVQTDKAGSETETQSEPLYSAGEGLAVGRCAWRRRGEQITTGPDQPYTRISTGWRYGTKEGMS